MSPFSPREKGGDEGHASLSHFEPFPVIPRHALVALRERRKLFAADHIVDVRERLVAGAPVDFLEDLVGRRAAIGAIPELLR